MNRHQWTAPPVRCGKGSIIGRSLDGSTIKIVPMTCNRWTCPRCAKRKAARWCDAIRAAKPTRLITLTCDPKRFLNPYLAYRSMKRAFVRLVRLARISFGDFEYVAAYELTQNGWPHIHILQRGDFVPQSWLSAWWDHLGPGPIVHIKAVPNTKTAAHYVVKYLVKNAGDTTTALGHGRIITTSRKFLANAPPDEPLPEDQQFTWRYTPIDYDDAIYIMQHAWGWIPVPGDDEDAVYFVGRDPPPSAFRLEHDEQVLLAKALLASKPPTSGTKT